MAADHVEGNAEFDMSVCPGQIGVDDQSAPVFDDRLHLLHHPCCHKARDAAHF